ncbi:MAG: DUF3368 domain-containing protein [Armatimonadetes bacterium]|nr:DUF3368 domain-containing protein [Armatimonadota bacterium]
MIVISDTSPLNYLILTKYIDALPQLYKRVLIPRTVYEELLHPLTPEAVRVWIGHPPVWLEVCEVVRGLNLPGLHQGELDAITLFKSADADLLLMDERLGREAAQTLGITITGTLGVLISAAQAELLDLEEALASLKATTFRISDTLIHKVLSDYRLR